VKGFGYYTLYTILLAGNNYAQLALFKYAPTISTIQLTFIRGLMCALVVLCMLTMRGQSWKKELITSIDKTTIKPLILRSASSGTCVFIAFISVKYFNVSTVGIVCALKPILTVVLAYSLLSIPVSFLDGVSNGVSLGAIALVILGTSGAESTNMETCAFAFIALMMQPILLAIGEILLK
jgi:drug/metabolite transporter (DMT)-like permease